MRPMRLHVTVAWLALAAACGWRTEKDVQRDYARALRPAEVEAPAAAASGAPAARVFRVRAYVDRDYQAQTLRWRQRVADQVSRANRVIEAQFGARLELVDVRDWPRTDRVDELRAALAELATLDAGGDVDWVIGFLSSLPVLTATHDQLGMAYYFGRHLVLRGMDSVVEAQHAQTNLDKLSAAEREDLLQRRRAHKETSVLLHEWAHTLGAFHERDPEWIMSPLYDKSQAGFSRPSAELVALGLRSRGAREAGARAAWGRAYLELVARDGESAWDARSRDEVVRIARAVLLGEPEPERAAAARAEPRDEAGPLAPEDPRKPCADGYRRARLAPATIEACRAAAALPGADLELVLLVPALLVERKDRAGAFRATSEAEAVVAARRGDARAWLRVAQLYATIDACSRAELAASRLPATHPAGKQILADCTRTRRWAGFRGALGGLPHEREPEYVALAAQARADVQSKNYARARVRAKELAEAFPGSAGPQLISCLVEGRAKAYARAKPACAAAAEVDDETIIPQQILGLIAADEGRLDEARERLRRAVELGDPSDEVWARLASIEKRRGDAAALAELKQRYRDRFGLELRAR